MKQFLLAVGMLATLHCIAQDEFVLIANTNVVDVATGKIIREASVLMKDGVIQDVFTNKRYKLPGGTSVIDGTAKYVMPGMTDAHIHFFQSGGLYTRPDAFDFRNIVPYAAERAATWEMIPDMIRRYLAAGVTTVADVGGPRSNFLIRDSVSRNAISPSVLVTGPLFSMVSNKPLDNGDPPIVRTTTIAQADSLMDVLLPLKPDYIKIWYIVTPDLPAEKTFPVVQHIARRTHAAGLKLAVHATQAKTAELSVDAGADILVHSVENEVVSEAFIRKLLASKVSYIPTLIVHHGYQKALTGKFNHHPVDLRAANPFAYGSLMDPMHMADDQLPSRILNARTATSTVDPNKRRDSVMAINLKRLYAAGVNVVAGTDAGNVGTMHGSSFAQELAAMKSAGLSNAEVLKSATVNSAGCFGRNSGLVAKGRRADVLVLKGNPLDDLAQLQAIDLVVLGGQLIKPDTLVKESPEMLVQRQLNAYNARDLDAFLDTYADDVELFNFPATSTGKGKQSMRERYAPLFQSTPNLHCEIVGRIRLGNTIIDHERVRVNDRTIEAVAIYEVKDGKIVKVTFKR